MADTPTIVMAGSLAQKPRHGGHTWVFLQYLLGLRRLGWDVMFLDRLESGDCTDADGRPCGLDESYNLRFLRDVMGRFGFEGQWALFYDRGRRVVGLSRQQVLERVGRSAMLLNVMGFFDEPEVLGKVRRRVFLDIDPGFGQMWRDVGLADVFAGHDQFVTIGQNVGKPDCLIPTCGLKWITTPQPVVLEHWPVARASSPDRPFTSVASWRGAYGPVEHGGKVYGLRAHEHRKFASLPRLTGLPFQLALDIHPADEKDKALLADNGWCLTKPTDVAGDPWVYQEFIGNSLAEFMVAKGIYVQTRSGWFSDRSICYLATGKPVVAQDTGLAELYPATEGLLLFGTIVEAAEAVRRVSRDYTRHARAARDIAEAHFNSDKVLARLLKRLDIER